ncbi:MAG TPA: dephospho-CoA kinase [Leptospiraceae bacterium]|nr:dephospho-CoA kinase [Leptospiraceae bacterium]HMW04786.1 dephospho-CoA kinase [Leptospiraceae bacterium]HMX32803.1 dephospho-CoA kinase [Leptospiraceae bacterium]HMY33546.1 dephospho-CoA kinase [Leptospiraceae bacterium]HMZ67564.1 dephospho-CoA kinase [Leptospiraceae bacterium]
MKEWNKRFVLGITGSMGGGKSTVTKIFEKLGAFRISSDEIARSFTEKDSPIKEELIQNLGKEILDENGDLDRKRIAGIVFSDKNAIAKLNGLIHPLVRKKTLELIDSVIDGRLVAWEAPLLFEAKGDAICDATLTVYAEYNDLWNRVKDRDGISEEEFRQRLANQMDIKKKLEASDFKIINNKDVRHLEDECANIYNSILNKKLS